MTALLVSLNSGVFIYIVLETVSIVCVCAVCAVCVQSVLQSVQCVQCMCSVCSVCVQSVCTVCAVCVRVCVLCGKSPRKSDEGVGSLELQLHSLELPCGCWELNPVL